MSENKQNESSLSITTFTDSDVEAEKEYEEIKSLLDIPAFIRTFDDITQIQKLTEHLQFF